MVQQSVRFTDGSRNVKGTGTGVCGQSVDIKLSTFLGKHAIAFRAEKYAILACVHETEYVNICSDSQAALTALQAAITTSPSVRRCQKALIDICTGTVGLYWVLGMPRCEDVSSPTRLQGTVLFKFRWT